MRTSRADIESWFDEGVKQNKMYMLVLCDTYDYEDYPVFTTSTEAAEARIKNPGEMQRVMEVYFLDMQTKQEQLNKPKCWSI